MSPGSIVDSHLHLWDPRHFRMPWLDGNTLLDQPYGLDEFREHAAGTGVAAMVYIEVDVAPPYALLEAQWAARLAEHDHHLQGVVAHAPLEYGDEVAAYLDALVAVGPLVKGVRRIVQAEGDPAFCLQPRFLRGVQLLPHYGLSCDLCINHTQLEATIEMVRRCPDTRFVLDHLGKPPIRERRLSPWREQIARLAALPNVMCKISGAVTEADHTTWTPADLTPYIAHVLDVFGEDRVMFGGDWPVALQATTYGRWVDALDGITAGLSDDARLKLWAANARGFYRLPQPSLP